KGELKAITTQSGIVLDGPFVPIPPPFINLEDDERIEETLTNHDLAGDPLYPNIPYPSRMHKQKQQEKDEVQIHNFFWQIFKQLHINITLADALILIPKYQKMLKALLSNKEKLLELVNTPLKENCSAIILKKLPEKLGDPGKFLIPYGFSELKCKALANLGASINLMPLFVWKKLGLPELISTRMTLELANRAICTPTGIIKSLNDNHTSHHVLNPLSPSPIPVEDSNSFLEKFDISLSYTDNSLPEFETFINHTEETNSGSTTTHADYSLPKTMSSNANVLTNHHTLMLDLDFILSDNSLPEYEIFYFDIKEKNSGSTTIHANISLSDLECFNFNGKPNLGELTSVVDFGIRENVLSATNMNLPPEEDHSPLFAYFVWIFFSFLTYPVVPPNLLSFRNEDTILTLASPIIISLHYCRMYLIGVKLS
nr:hypothetical protein [Tanacetum cinerariifolium]